MFLFLLLTVGVGAGGMWAVQKFGWGKEESGPFAISSKTPSNQPTTAADNKTPAQGVVPQQERSNSPQTLGEALGLLKGIFHLGSPGEVSAPKETPVVEGEAIVRKK